MSDARSSRLVALASTLTLGALGACAAAGDVCEQAIDIMTECTGVPLEMPAEGCVGEYRAIAEEVVAEGCDANVARADEFWCRPAVRWLGLCKDIPLAEAAILADLADVCPADRGDELCAALRAGDFAGARDEIALKLSTDRTMMRDPAVRYYVRERMVSLLVWNVLTDQGRRAAPTSYASAASDVLDEHFPAYAEDRSLFSMARRPIPPVAADCQVGTGVVFFPGVVRLFDRLEFVEQAEAIEAALPCVAAVVVDTGSFVPPATNADRAVLAVAELDARIGSSGRLHLVGYSQGSSNALRTLVDKPSIAARVDTVLTMNSAARGSEVADLLFRAISFLDKSGQFCAGLPEWAQPTCEWAASLSPRPPEQVMGTIAKAMAVPVDQLAEWIEAEDQVAAAPTLRDFLIHHLPGVRSLTTSDAADFWSGPAERLPRDVLYTSFRSVITDPTLNLPSSNKLFHNLLARAGERVPYNDMQVRLENQEMGGPIADNEVVLPVAEGNHWQWELATGAVPDNVMPRHMTDRVPHRELMVAYVQVLHDIGLIF